MLLVKSLDFVLSSWQSGLSYSLAVTLTLTDTWLPHAPLPCQTYVVVCRLSSVVFFRVLSSAFVVVRLLSCARQS